MAIVYAILIGLAVAAAIGWPALFVYVIVAGPLFGYAIGRDL